MVGHFLALVVGQGQAQRRRDGVQGAGKRAGRDIGFACGHMHQHHEARGAFDQRANGAGSARPQNQVAFPMARHQAAFNFRRPVLDVRNVAQLAPALAALRLAAPCGFVLTQARDQFTFQLARGKA